MINGINKYLHLSLFISLILLMSCGRKVVYTGTHEMPDRIWKLMDIAEFQVSVTDTITKDNIMFTIRTGSYYPYRNIYLFVSTTSPDGREITDTLQYNLADDKGKWYGKGLGDIHELNLPYKSNVFFPVKGTYIFSVQHGMRDEDLKGVYDIGLRIEKVGK